MVKTLLSKLLSTKFNSTIKLADFEREAMERPTLNEDEKKSLEELIEQDKCYLVCNFLEKWLVPYMELHQLNFKHLFGGVAMFLSKQETKVVELVLTWSNCRMLAEQQAREAATPGRELP